VSVSKWRLMTKVCNFLMEHIGNLFFLWLVDDLDARVFLSISRMIDRTQRKYFT
jgi:hypothetical protein